MASTQTTRDPLEHFAYEILRAAGLDALPEEAKSEFIVKIRDQAQRRMGVIAVQHLDAGALEEFNAMMAASAPPDPTAMQTFFTAKIPDFESKMQAGLLTFADEFVAAAKAK
ncbi:MAG: hypothetical protein Q7S02_01580 [bacterium]|nr:hypothetical protein [bacterium]